MNEVEITQKTIATLTDKRDRTAARVTEIAEERKSIGFAVHADGDAKARKRLDQLNADDAAMAGELQSLDAALAEAQSRLAQAQQAEAQAAALASAVELRQALAEFIDAGRDLDAILADLVEASKGMRACLSKVHALGCPHPTDQQLLSLGKFCLLTALGETPFRRDFQPLAPRERRSFTSLFELWAANIENNQIKPLLEKETADAVAA